MRNGKSNQKPRAFFVDIRSFHHSFVSTLSICLSLNFEYAMSLVAGPGRGGAISDLPAELQLYAQKHVVYIQSLDTVRRHCPRPPALFTDARNSGSMNSNTGSPNTCV
jgi:hypothetical protein